MAFCCLHSSFLARLTRPLLAQLSAPLLRWRTFSRPVAHLFKISTFSVITFCYDSTAKPIFNIFWDMKIFTLVKGIIISGMEYANNQSIFMIDFCTLTTMYIQVCRQFLLSNTLTRFLARWKNFPDIWRSLSNLDWVIQNSSNNINKQIYCRFSRTKFYSE